MSLDSYPFQKRRTIHLEEQPLALNVAYDDNLLILATDQCQSIMIYDLSIEDSNNVVKKFPVGKGIVVDQIIYCRTGDYLACVGHNDGHVSIYTIFNWRNEANESSIISELDLDIESVGQDLRNKLSGIDCCQKTGNLAISYGDLVLIFKYPADEDQVGVDSDNDDIDSIHSKMGAIKENLSKNNSSNNNFVKHHFKHIISIKLSINALKICLLENYLSVAAVDHVQVLKLELLTLQIQSDGVDGTDSQTTGLTSNSGSDAPVFNGARSETVSTSTTIATSCSMISDTNSTTTNFSSFNNNTGEFLDNSDMSIITMNQHPHYDFESDPNNDSSQSADDCITWNLNTKKLVKLPTLMHNTSTSLSSYHICHPLELLGPASESIACRVNCSIYSADYSQNQLEPVVMLCKQFDYEKDPLMSANLQAVYLSSMEDQRRLTKSGVEHECGCDQLSGSSRESSLLKSAEHELLASVTCFVSTLSNCFVYTLHGKKVSRSQTITHPDLCLDLRADLLNVYLLTPLGLQICSSGSCDSTFRYDWSSSSDLNLSFMATDRTRVLTSSRYVIMLASCSASEGQCVIEYLEKPNLNSLFSRIVHTVNRCNSISIRSNLLTYLHATAQLALLELAEDSGERASVLKILRSVTIMLCKQLLQKKQTNVITNSRIDKAIKHLLDISMCDFMELMRRHSSRAEEGPEEFDTSLAGQLEGVEPIGEGGAPRLDDDDKPLDTDHELIKIYLKHAKYSQTMLDYLLCNWSNEELIRTIIGYMFEHNPRLLIKCAQRYPLSADPHKHRFPVRLLVDKLKQLTEFDSTGINRATVLFTLAILYNTLEDRQKCLATLGQIKPLNHLAITMRSNYELSHSIAPVVREHYPDVFNLFLSQLARRDKLAAREFVHDEGVYERASAENSDNELPKAEDEDHDHDHDELEENPDVYELKLKLLADIPTCELVELLAPDEPAHLWSPQDKLTSRAYLEASINLLESQFILMRLRENSH